jgi:hypothetical protein
MKLRWRVVVAVAASAAVGAVIVVILFWSRVDPGLDPGVRIENRTGIHLEVFAELSDGTRVPVADLAPGEAADSTGRCVLDDPLIAEASDGRIVARFGPFEECNEGPWIIRAPQ